MCQCDEDFPIPFVCFWLVQITNCLDGPENTNQDCLNCSYDPYVPCQLCSPCIIPFAFICDIIFYPFILCNYKCYKYKNTNTNTNINSQNNNTFITDNI